LSDIDIFSLLHGFVSNVFDKVQITSPTCNARAWSAKTQYRFGAPKYVPHHKPKYAKKNSTFLKQAGERQQQQQQQHP